jgi:hypothetical protein
VVAALRIDIRVVGGGDDGRTPTTSGFGRLRRGVMVRLRVGGGGGVTSVTSDGWTVDRIKEDKEEVGEEEKVVGSPQRWMDGGYDERGRSRSRRGRIQQERNM